jgi:hypothetical protein
VRGAEAGFSCQKDGANGEGLVLHGRVALVGVQGEAERGRGREDLVDVVGRQGREGGGDVVHGVGRGGTGASSCAPGRCGHATRYTKDRKEEQSSGIGSSKRMEHDPSEAAHMVWARLSIPAQERRMGRPGRVRRLGRGCGIAARGI